MITQECPVELSANTRPNPAAPLLSRRGQRARPLILLAFASIAASCSPGLAARMTAESEAREKVERSAVRWVGQDAEVTPGVAKTLHFEVRIAEGFYLPAPGSADAGIEPLSLLPPTLSYIQTERVDLPPQATVVRLKYLRDPLPCYDGTRTIAVRVRVALGTAPGKRKLTYLAIWQQCTLHGCSVPRQEGIDVWLDVQPTASGSLDDLAP